MNFDLKTHTIGKVYDLTQENMCAMIAEIEELQAALKVMRDGLVEAKKDIETNAADVIWSHDVISMTCVDRIDIAIEEADALLKGGEG